MYKATIILTLFFLLAIALSAYSDEKNVTPYGDYCKGCSSYGTCRNVLSPKKALNLLNGYYEEKGYSVRKAHHVGRFIEADIYKHDKQVDKVIFDRKTGRLRSAY